MLTPTALVMELLLSLAATISQTATMTSDPARHSPPTLVLTMVVGALAITSPPTSVPLTEI